MNTAVQFLQYFLGYEGMSAGEKEFKIVAREYFQLFSMNILRKNYDQGILQPRVLGTVHEKTRQHSKARYVVGIGQRVCLVRTRPRICPKNYLFRIKRAIFPSHSQNQSKRNRTSASLPPIQFDRLLWTLIHSISSQIKERYSSQYGVCPNAPTFNTGFHNSLVNWRNSLTKRKISPIDVGFNENIRSWHQLQFHIGADCENLTSKWALFKPLCSPYRYTRTNDDDYTSRNCVEIRTSLSKKFFTPSYRLEKHKKKSKLVFHTIYESGLATSALNWLKM